VAQAAAAAPIAALLVPSVSRRVTFQPRADSTNCWPVLQDLDVITAVRGIRSGQVAYVAETLDQPFQTDLGRDEILAMVLLLMDQRRDFSNYLRDRAIQSISTPRYILR